MANKFLKEFHLSHLDCTTPTSNPLHMLRKKIQNVDTFQTWHDRLGHPGVGMMPKIIKNAIDHNLNEAKFPQSSDFVCTACATGKLILRPSYLKVKAEPLKFLERI